MNLAFEPLALLACARPGMYAGSDRFVAVCAYLSGFDAARDGEPLLAFQPWLVLRHDGADHAHWTVHVIREALGGPRTLDELSADDDRRCLAKLRELLTEFFEDRKRRSAQSIYQDYHQWQTDHR